MGADLAGGANAARYLVTYLEADSPAAVAAILADHPFIGRGGELQISEPAPI